MPVYLFTFHAYRSWMPDREEGYTQRNSDVRLPNVPMARQYNLRAKLKPVHFTTRLQDLLIEETQIAAKHQNLRVHAVATETTHVHALVSWRDERQWDVVREALKKSLSRRLNRELKRKRTLVQRASRRHVEDQEHFDYLFNEYLPSHRGQKWFESKVDH